MKIIEKACDLIDAPFPVLQLLGYITVISASLRTFTVSCIPIGGRALNITVTGPSGMVTTGNISAATEPGRRGRDAFIATTDTITGGNDRDTYHCTASNGVATDLTSDVVLRGNLPHIGCV